MLDTLKLMIDTSDESLDKIKAKSHEYGTRRSEFKDRLPIMVYRQEVEIGSYDYHINVFLNEGDHRFSVEFSAPKVLYGHNIYLLYPNKLELVLQKVKSQLEETFDITLPHYKYWILQRLDICYAWKLQSEEDAYIAFLLLQIYEYDRKRMQLSATGFVYKGSAYDFKVYMKHPEFLVHDAKRFKGKGGFRHIQYPQRLELIDTLADLARGVLRIEVTMRKEQVTYLFGKEAHYADLLDQQFLINTLNLYFSKFIKKTNTMLMDYHEAVKRIFNVFPPRKAWPVVTFYNYIYSPDKMVRKFNRLFMKSKKHRTTIRRRFNDLATAGVGIPKFDRTLEFDFKIPSDYVINTEEDDIAEAMVLSSDTGVGNGTAVESKSRASEASSS